MRESEGNMFTDVTKIIPYGINRKTGKHIEGKLLPCINTTSTKQLCHKEQAKL